MKTFQEVLSDRQQTLKTRNIPALEEKNEISVIAEKNKTLVSDFKKQVLSKDLQEIPALNVDLILHNNSINPELRNKLSLIKDELVHGYHIVPRRRTDCEKRISVLQDNRFTTHGSKFFQANLEQQVHQQNLVGVTLEIEEINIELEKLLYEYKKLENKIEKSKVNKKYNDEASEVLEKGSDQEIYAFDKSTDEIFLLEKDLQILSIKIRKKLVQLKEQKMNAENESLELLEWSKIKEEEFALALFANEAFDPNDVNYGQYVHLAKRFFYNYLNTHTTNADATTSDVLNIDGLCLTALNVGIKHNLLGQMFDGFSEDQIKFIWNGIFGQELDFFKDEEGLTRFKVRQTSITTSQN